ncbi:NUDIX domain-containing protein [Catenulispora subtropica]|uniref:Nudix hydrolase domain-containing protein n=1 Tax=Catenulispora subtropica TaxID=450798 RepID=A0ABN2RGZ9_9ACTN
MDAPLWWQVIAQQKAWLDGHPNTDQALAVPLRVLKVAEEAGEAAAALIGVSGQNPRKGTSHTTADLAAELCDVITAASVALASVVPDPEQVLKEHIGRIYMRSVNAGAPRMEDLGLGADYVAWALSMPKVSVGAAVIFTDEDGRVLLVRQPYRADGKWSFPGGVVEDDEFPADAARREALEELGLEVAPGALLEVDWRPRMGDRLPLIQFAYDGGTLSADDIARIRLQEAEIAEIGFFDLDGARERLNPHMYARLEHIVAVREGRETVQGLREGQARSIG